jgi:hypothetical protein
MILKPYLAKQASLHEAMYVYLSVERAVFEGLQMTVAHWAEQVLGVRWHEEMVADPENQSLKGWDSSGDPYYIVKALAKVPASPFFGALPPHHQIANLAWEILHNRNLWAHYGNNETMQSIKNDIEKLVSFARVAGLSVEEAVRVALGELTRVTAAAAGLKPLVPQGTTASPRVSLAIAPAAPKPPARPRIGSPWEGELSATKLELNPRQKDILEPLSGDSGRPRWPSPESADAAVKRWLALGLSTPYLHVDESDGATVGFLDGHPFLIGYVGEEPVPSEGQYRGFLGEATYVYNGEVLASKDSGREMPLSPEQLFVLRNATSLRSVGSGEAFRVTNYGDLVHLGEEGPVRLLTL